MRAGALVLDEPVFRRSRLHLPVPVVLFAFVSLAATLMARGIGL